MTCRLWFFSRVSKKPFLDGQIVRCVTDVLWAVKFPDVEGFRHPLVLYDDPKNVLLIALALRVRRSRPTQRSGSIASSRRTAASTARRWSACATIWTARQTLQARLDNTIYIHRAQFEKEFEALSEIWKRIAELRAVFEAFALRARDGSQETEYFTEIAEKIKPRFYAFFSAVDHQSSFYPEDIYAACSETIDTVRLEMTLAQTESAKDVKDYFRQRRAARHDFEQRAKEISDLIRARLSALSVLD